MEDVPRLNLLNDQSENICRKNIIPWQGIFSKEIN